MNIEEIIKAWKSEEQTLDDAIPENPVGRELSEQQLQEVTGGMVCAITCDDDWTCSVLCFFVRQTGVI
ncbi:hypothetical protein KDH_71380 [Dictyobacter sp. S3.2.2.5]|uniref:Mersacidin/lichenicidin family type 2 lantibiotic n=1 Tax=Dictyobacter halimunensis TaxID=3026934 RepID=A0ABQ6G1C6_9CHLR|nr:hypothetical protein KDH_71380 [Dictyobacter sp. S3.2.2.5]